MNNATMSGILIILCLFVFLQVIGDIGLIFEKRKFVKYLKEQFQCTLEEKAPLFAHQIPDFAALAKCGFLEEEKTAEYVSVYSDKDSPHCTLFHFFYEEKEREISERLEITEFEKRDWEKIVTPYDLTLINGMRRKIENIKHRGIKWQKGKKKV